MEGKKEGKEKEADLVISPDEDKRTQLNLQIVTAQCEQKDNKIRELSKIIIDLQQLVNDKDAKIRKEETQRRVLHNTIQELKGNIIEYSADFGRQLKMKKTARWQNFRSVTINDVKGAKKKNVPYHFSFDKIFNEKINQENIFQEVEQLVQSALDGYRYKMEARYLEIYNENIRDLLASDDSLKYEIKMVGNGKTNSDSEVTVTNLKVIPVDNEKQVYLQ
ncbi:Kinesin-like protein 2 [Exaiptasia diaphana]|nr:Kinesin-like protein 2 [Exaiptasia diaphana]